MSGDEYTPSMDGVVRFMDGIRDSSAMQLIQSGVPADYAFARVDALLAAHVATRIREAQAEALEDVAHDFENLASDCPVWSANAATWLRARAASIRTNERTTDDCHRPQG